MLRNSRSKWSMSEMRGRFREIEADLRDQGIRFYPPTTAGDRARTLWQRIKHPLLRGASVEITAAALRFDWHREELRRAKTILIDMELIKPRADGRYVLGGVGPFNKIDELIRDEFFLLKLAEAAVVALSALMPKSKTHEKNRPSSASHISGAGNIHPSTRGNNTKKHRDGSALVTGTAAS